MNIQIERIHPNPDQPRRKFDAAGIEALAESIRKHGLLNPIAVTRHPEHAGHYLLVDGERRWRACQMAGRETIEAHLVAPDDLRLRATLANTQRADLNPVEEALAIKALRDEHYTLERICKAIGRSVPYVYGRLALLGMDADVQELVANGELPGTPAALQAIMALPSGKRSHYAREFARRGMSVRMIVRTCERIQRNLTWQKEDDRANIANDLPAETAPAPAARIPANDRKVFVDDTPARANVPTETKPAAVPIGGGMKGAGIPAPARFIPPTAAEKRKTFDLVAAFRIRTPAATNWEGVTAAARYACMKCVLIDEAGPRNCRDCPLVTALLKIGGQ